MSYLEVAPQLCMEQCQLEGPSHGSLRYGGWGQVPVAEEVVVVVGAEAALRALFLPVDAGGVDEGTKHGWSRQPGFGEEGTESGCLRCLARVLYSLSPRRFNISWGSSKPLSTLLPSLSLIRRWTLT